MQFWNAIVPGQIPEHPVVPGALNGDVIDLEGHQLRIITVAQAESTPSTFVHIPALDAVVAYDGIYQFLAFADHYKRLQWIASVEQVEQLNPQIVVAGHKDPDARDDNPVAVLAGTKAYISDFNQALSHSRSAQELVDTMMNLHCELGNPYTLWTSAQAMFEQGQASSS